MTHLLHPIIFLAVSFISYWFIIPKDWRNKFLFLSSIYFISMFGPQYAVYFVSNALLVYYAGFLMSRSEKYRKLILKLSLVWLVGSLAVVKYVHLLLNSIFKIGASVSLMPETIFSQIILPLGFSYIIFRLIHYIVEMYRKTLPEHTFWDLGLYVFFFPTFLSGPIDRFQRVQPQTAAKKPIDTSDLNYGLFRIIIGMIRKFIIADALLMPAIMPFLNSPQDLTHMQIIISIYAIAFQLYMDFAGYTDMAIGVSRLFGYKIVENFKNPYMKTNIAHLWRSFHISFYDFIRDYFFLPLFGFRASQTKIYIGLFLTMLVTSLRHEGNMQWLLLGIYHGTGLVVWQAFQELKMKNPRLRKLVDHRNLIPFWIFITMSFFSFGLIFFYFDLQGIKEILNKLFL